MAKTYEFREGILGQPPSFPVFAQTTIGTVFPELTSNSRPRAQARAVGSDRRPTVCYNDPWRRPHADSRTERRASGGVGKAVAAGASAGGTDGVGRGCYAAARGADAGCGSPIATCQR